MCLFICLHSFASDVVLSALNGKDSLICSKCDLGSMQLAVVSNVLQLCDAFSQRSRARLLSTLQEEFTDEASPQCGYGGEDCIALNLFSGFWDAVFEESPDPFHLGECQDLTSSTVLRTGVQTLAALGGGDLVLFQAQTSAPSDFLMGVFGVANSQKEKNMLLSYQ